MTCEQRDAITTTQPGRAWMAVALALLLGACGSQESGQPTAANDAGASASGPTSEVTEADYDLSALLAQADVNRGRTLFLQCRACHSLDAGGIHKVGPNIHGVFGKPAAQVAGFAFSEQLVNAGIIWTPETMDPWIRKPAELVPGNKMVFIGIRDAQDRANLIAYLQEATAPAVE